MYFRTWEKKKKKKKQGKSKTLAKLPRNQVSQRTMKFKCSMQATARQFNNKSNINRKACQFLWYSVCSLYSIYQSVQNPFMFYYIGEQKHREIDLICLDLRLIMQPVTWMEIRRNRSTIKPMISKYPFDSNTWNSSVSYFFNQDRNLYANNLYHLVISRTGFTRIILSFLFLKSRF